MSAGVQVSAHPEAVRRLGTKDVLFETRDLPFGSEVHRIDSPAQLAADLPLLWDCDFMLGESAPGDGPRWVLCEINVSSVSPFPPSAIAPLVAALQARLATGAGRTA